jgi:hypothetical protein
MRMYHGSPGNISKTMFQPGNVNVAVATYVTTQTRVKLHCYLSKLGRSVLYCDTDSVIYVQKVGKPPKVVTGDYLGDFTNELEEFVSGSFI